MKRIYAGLATAAAIASVPVVFTTQANATPGLCTDPQCINCIRVQSYGNCADPPSDAPQQPQVASNDPVIPQMPPQPNNVPYDKPGGSPLRPVYPKPHDPNEALFPPTG
jgi:hypothetical protein